METQQFRLRRRDWGVKRARINNHSVRRSAEFQMTMGARWCDSPERLMVRLSRRTDGAITRTAYAEFRWNHLIIRGATRNDEERRGEERPRPGDYISWSPEQNRIRRNRRNRRREDLEPQPTTTEGEEKNPVSTPCVCYFDSETERSL